MIEHEYCGGPGAKEIFLTRSAAREALCEYRRDKRANAHQGKVYRCRWGEHYHYSSKRNPGKAR